MHRDIVAALARLLEANIDEGGSVEPPLVGLKILKKYTWIGQENTHGFKTKKYTWIGQENKHGLKTKKYTWIGDQPD